MRSGLIALPETNSSFACLPSTVMITVKRSGWLEGWTSNWLISRISAQGPSNPSGVPLPSDSLICDATRGLGHVSVCAAVLPAVNLKAWPSMSSVRSFMPSLISTTRTSTLKPGCLPPARKNASLMRAARSKSASAAPPGGLLPSGSGR